MSTVILSLFIKKQQCAFATRCALFPCHLNGTSSVKHSSDHVHLSHYLHRGKRGLACITPEIAQWFMLYQGQEWPSLMYNSPAIFSGHQRSSVRVPDFASLWECLCSPVCFLISCLLMVVCLSHCPRLYAPKVLTSALFFFNTTWFWQQIWHDCQEGMEEIILFLNIPAEKITIRDICYS